MFEMCRVFDNIILNFEENDVMSTNKRKTQYVNKQSELKKNNTFRRRW